ncbi:MAG TPA: TraR/DksA C4-type zinc finger protein [Patescibacteria group bacterium]|nr:TraR/DksA C4-type zinc finger protein [Patescibacteria group bacterium]
MKKPIAEKTSLRFPSNLLNPVAHFLSARLDTLKKRKKALSKEDPFKDTARVDDNAAPDIEADEQFGHARVSAISKEVSKGIIQIRKALTRVRIGKYGICEDCGQMIDTDRLIVFPEATLCAKDARKREK